MNQNSVNKVLLFTLSIVFLGASGASVFAVNEIGTGGDDGGFTFKNEDSRQILDLRCKREKLLRGVEEAGQAPSEYSQTCCEDGNTETMIDCMEVVYSTYDDESLWGNKGFNYLGTDIVLTRETVPLIIRMVLTVVFALFTAYYGWISFIGMYEYLTAATQSHNYENAEKHFSSALMGLLVGGGGVLFTHLIFVLMGYKGNAFDFGPILDKSFLIDCGAIETQEHCERYDISCNWASECIKIDPLVQSETRDGLSEGYCQGYISSFTCEN